MDVYQACRAYPHLRLNSLSLAPDIQTLQDPRGPNLSKNETLSATIEDIYPWCSTPLLGLSAPEKQKQLRRRWSACKPLRDSRAYAIEPLPHVLAEASMYFGEQGNFAHSLCISSFIATKIEPYKSAAPFAPQRVKGVFMVAKLLANTAPADLGPRTKEDSLISSKSLVGKISTALGKMDQATMCQALLEMVVYYAPAAHSKGWAIFHEARDLLSDIGALQGRENEDALVKAFMRNPNGLDERQFFDQAVLGPLRELSKFCFDIMDSEFGS